MLIMCVDKKLRYFYTFIIDVLISKVVVAAGMIKVGF